MSIVHLPTDYVDGECEFHKYKITDTGDSTAMVEDVTEYTTEGSYFGATEINNTNSTINAVIDLEEANTSSISRVVNGQIVVDSSEDADEAQTADTINGASINGVPFDGSSNIQVSDATKVSKADSFILRSKQALSFANKVCIISDDRITEDSLAEVIFTPACLDDATKSVISVETSDGALTLTAGRTPASTLIATIYIRS